MARIHQVAVLGESGSGKTTLLATFYGRQQSAAFDAANRYRLRAAETSQGTELLTIYHRLSGNALAPATKFAERLYTFDLLPTGSSTSACQLKWIDYPGEWWTETPTSNDEQERKRQALASLIQSDVAILLLDGARFKQDPDLYTNRLLKSFRDELGRIRVHLTRLQHLPLAAFPRVWVLALSKCDLLPGVSAEHLREQVSRAAHEEVMALQEEMRTLIRTPNKLSIGTDYLLLSSALFSSDNPAQVVDPNKTVGIEVITGIAAIAPIRHAVFWNTAKSGTGSASKTVLNGLRKATIGWMKHLPYVGKPFKAADWFARRSVDKLRQYEEKARSKGYALEAVQANMDKRLRDSVKEHVYVSPSMG